MVGGRTSGAAALSVIARGARGLIFWIVLGAAASAAQQAPAQILYVDDDAPPDGDGSSWQSAFRFLQDALTEARPLVPSQFSEYSAIHVAAGTYVPDRDEAHPEGTGDREATFSIVHFVDVIGGFAGLDSANPDTRDVAAHEAILNGDLLGDDGPEFGNREDNVYHVVSALDAGFSDGDELFTLDGFTVRGGNANGPLPGGQDVDDGRAWGGGITSDNYTDLLLDRCTIEDNEAVLGGGIGVGWGYFLAHVVLTIRSTSIVNNRANEGSWGGDGGGIYLGWECDAFLFGCDVSNNTAIGSGGGIMGSWECVTRLTNCTVTRNLAGADGGGLFDGAGWPSAVNSVIAGNAAWIGGGMWLWDSDPFAGSIRNTVIYGNAAATGGGIHLKATCNWGGFGSSYGPFAFRNCIIWGNESQVGPQFGVSGSYSCGSVSIESSDVQGGLADPFDALPLDSHEFTLIWSHTSITTDPLLTDPENGDFRLLADSPCIDFGILDDIDACTIDFGGNLRLGAGPIDIGPHEFGSSAAVDCDLDFIDDLCEIENGDPDCNGDRVPDHCNIASLESIDCNENGVPDECELASGASYDDDGNDVLDQCEAPVISCPSAQPFVPVPPQTGFGSSVAISKDFAVIASEQLPRVLHYDGLAWEPSGAGVLPPSGVAPTYSYGKPVAVDGHVILVAASSSSVAAPYAGAVYAHDFDGADWSTTYELRASDAAASDSFGNSVAIDGEAAVIGAPYADPSGTSSGAAYVFRWDGSTWHEEAKLLPPNGMQNAYFGSSVAIDGNLIAVGAPGEYYGNDPGTAYVYACVGSTWTLSTILVPPTSAARQHFGTDVAVSGEVVLVGAPGYESIGTVIPPAAHVYRSNGGATWWHEATLVPWKGLGIGSHFAEDVALSGDLAIVRAGTTPGLNSLPGCVFVHHYDGEGWKAVAKLSLFSPGDVDLDGDRAIVGATGAASIYANLSNPDCNDNGTADACEIELDPSGDLDHDGVLDSCEPPCATDIDGSGSTGFADLIALLVGWGACPASIPCPGDVDADGIVGANDLVLVLIAWGPCPAGP